MLIRIAFSAIAAVFVALGAWMLVGSIAPEPPATSRVPSLVQFQPAVQSPQPGPVDEVVIEPAAGEAPTPAADGLDPVVSSAGSVVVDAAWLARASAMTGIPEPALGAYATATLRLASDQPGCGLGWNTLAAIGAVESGHGTHGGAVVGGDGVVRPGIFGPRLDGVEFAHIADSDGGALDGDATIDRAVGPFQFIPQTWQTWGSDGDGDGLADPQDIADAAFSAGRYLCSYGDLSGTDNWRRAVFAYNHDEDYVDLIAATAVRFGQLAQ